MIIGTAGHIDHGKTSLVRLLTGVDTDRLQEEKKRGISIDLGFAYLPAEDGSIIGFIDVPGHEKFVHNMLAGATGIDFVLLVVAADDGVMPQTREHMAIIDLLGIENGIVAITKSDLAGPERLQEVRTEIENVLAATALKDAEVLPVSVVTKAGIEALRARLFAEASSLRRRSAEGRFRLAVDRSFTLQGTGTVVTGTVLSGTVRVGDPVVVSPPGLTARVRSIHAQNRVSELGQAGDRCALNLAGDKISKEAIHRGNVVLDPGLHAPTDRIDASVRVLASEQKPLVQWMPVRLHHAATEVGARIVLLSDEAPAPGSETLVQLVLEEPVAAAEGDRFILRDTAAQRTIGGGRFLDLRAPSRKRRTPERMAQLAAHAKDNHAEALDALLEGAPGFAEISSFTRDRALGAKDIQLLLESPKIVRLPTPKVELAIAKVTWERLKRAIRGTLELYHKENPDLAGMGFEKLRLQLEPRVPVQAFSALLDALVSSREISLDGAWIRLPGHEVKLTPQDEALWVKIRPLISDAERFRPPRVRDIANLLHLKEIDVRRFFKILSRMGRVDEVAHDHFFLRGTVAEMVAICVDIAAQVPNGEFSAAQLRDRLDNGRKVAIQILEFFDRHGITLRRGDLRRINKHRLDLFRRRADEASVATEPSGRASSPVGRPDFKSGKGREPVLGGFDSHSLPPNQRSSAR